MSEYDNNGTTPGITSRDGFTNTASFLNYYYFNEAKTFYFTTGYDFERADTDGYNYIRNSHSGRIGLHFPLVWKMDLDLSYMIKDSNYIKYQTPPKRRDDVHTFTAALSRPLNAFLTLSFNYIFEDSRARNNAFEYTKNIIGAKLGAKF